MKTTLKILSLFSTAALPGALALETAGLPLPAQLGLGTVFNLFVASLVMLIAFCDYARLGKPRLVATSPVPKSSHPLAA